jgi:hypothetical protein
MTDFTQYSLFSQLHNLCRVNWSTANLDNVLNKWDNGHNKLLHVVLIHRDVAISRKRRNVIESRSLWCVVHDAST